MLLCYIDESGNTGNNLKDIHQPYLVLAALLVPPENIKDIENDIRTLGYKYFSAESRNTDFEFHGDDIYNKRGRYFKKLSLEHRIQILDELVDIAIKYEPIKIGYVSVEKIKYDGDLHVQQSAFSILVGEIERYLQRYRRNTYCLLIADEQDEIEQNIIDDLEYFKQNGVQLWHEESDDGAKKYINLQNQRIIDSVHFVKSNNNYLMQLTDVICYLIRRGKESNIKLTQQYKLGQIAENKIDFSQWLEGYGHKGQKYFYKTYNRMNLEKGWLFSKDFP